MVRRVRGGDGEEGEMTGEAGLVCHETTYGLFFNYYEMSQ